MKKCPPPLSLGLIAAMQIQVEETVESLRANQYSGAVAVNKSRACASCFRLRWLRICSLWYDMGLLPAARTDLVR
jgi:hypothetical protein